MYLLRIDYHFAQKKKRLITKSSNFFFLLKKMSAETKTWRSSLCASAGVADRSGRWAATSWSCSDTSQPGEVASVYRTSYTSVAFPNPPPLGRNEETAIDA